MVYDKLVKITINTLRLANIILNIVICHYRFFNLIISDRGSLFTFKFWSLLYYLLNIKRCFFITFYSQQTVKSSRIKAL